MKRALLIALFAVLTAWPSLGYARTRASANYSISIESNEPLGMSGQSTNYLVRGGNVGAGDGIDGHLLNVSTRLRALTGDNVLIGGFIVAGPENKTVVLRALGPTLQKFGVPGTLPDPVIELHDSQTMIATNDDWKETQENALQATGLAPADDAESAILRTLAPGNYTAIVRGKNGGTGVAVVEAYDLSREVNSTLANISTRGFVDVDSNVMIGGFISVSATKVIVRALGPSLAQFGVPNVLLDPIVELYDAEGTIITSNDDWAQTQQSEIEASGFAPPDSREPAIVIARPNGNTTAIVRGKNNTIGNALVEVYALAP